uniref:Uncharacterized protein n=1 Tax=Anguilla anguilla TaxID=7936 RepID=A0A0E9T6E5_ANGAN
MSPSKLVSDLIGSPQNSMCVCKACEYQWSSEQLRNTGPDKVQFS